MQEEASSVDALCMRDYVLCHACIKNYTGFNVETINYKNVNLTAWDVGGRDKIVRHRF